MLDEIEQVIAKWRQQIAHNREEQQKCDNNNTSIILGHRIDVRTRCADELEAVLRRSRAVPSPGGAAEKDTPSMRFRKKPVVIEAQQFYADKCVKDEFYPCKPDVFAATYRLAESRAVLAPHQFERRNTSSYPHCVRCGVPEGSNEAGWQGGKCPVTESRSVPPTTAGGNETIIDEDGIYQSRPPRPFAALRAKMPPESQVRAAARTEEMLSEIRTAETRAVLPEPPCCERHGVMVARDQMGREWYCAVCGIVSPDTDTAPSQENR